jgi:hypothetical protein
MTGRTTEDVFRNTRAMLEIARLGVDDLAGSDPLRKPIGILVATVFGRSVTYALQGMNGRSETFPTWYARKQAEMRADPLLRYFHELRNRILKAEGPPAFSTVLELDDERDPDKLRYLKPPPGGTSYYVGPGLPGGQSGWRIDGPEGSPETFYVWLSEPGQEPGLHFPDPPTEHQGEAIADTSLENLARLYIDYLSALVEEAEAMFSQPDPS